MIHFSPIFSSLQQSVSLAVMKNMASVTNLESASKSEKLFSHKGVTQLNHNLTDA